MRRRKSILLFALLAVLLPGLWLLFRGRVQNRASADETAMKEELAKFLGPWEFASLDFDRNPERADDIRKYRTEFKGDQWLVWNGTNLAAQSTIVLNPAANPKTIDAYPPPGRGLPIHGIYKMEGGTLTIFDRGEDQGERPTDFRPDAGSGLVRIVYRRPRP